MRERNDSSGRYTIREPDISMKFRAGFGSDPTRSGLVPESGCSSL